MQKDGDSHRPADVVIEGLVGTPGQNSSGKADVKSEKTGGVAGNEATAIHSPARHKDKQTRWTWMKEAWTAVRLSLGGF